MATEAPYPVSVTGELDPEMNPWGWLFQWFLAIPHVVVLFVLWGVFLVLTVWAFFAIAFTGKYPRGIFDFNVGVLRWSWRVSFYAYSAFGTDRYPPFSLSSRDYPANLEVQYPEDLSRSLVWVKSWLLAIPHYMVVSFFGGAGKTGLGLTTVLAIIGSAARLLKGEYPADIFKLVMGINRWSLRVVAYAALMTDRYPPFRLEE
jgi:hypothetical protein